MNYPRQAEHRAMETLRLEHVCILSVEGMRARRLCYKGCDIIFYDGIACGLGILARKKAVAMEWRFGRRNRTGHHCRPIGQGPAMFHLILNTSVGTFHSWNEVGEKLLGIMAEELMSRTHILCLLEDTLQRVTSNNWRLMVESTTTRRSQLH